MRIRMLAVLLLALVGLGTLGAGDRAAAGFRQAEVPDSITVPLESLNDSDITGSVMLRAEDGSTLVTLSLFAPDGAYPAHIHVGTCAPFEANPTFPLADGDPNAATTTVVELPFEQLLDNGWVVVVHKPSDDLNVLLNPESAVACGELTTEAAETQTNTDGTDETPGTGVGSTIADATHRSTIWLMTSLAILFTFAAYRIRRAPALARQPIEKGRF